ncbi:MAG: pentapeptide repeat-containing protein, partial [Nitrospirales bacterium]
NLAGARLDGADLRRATVHGTDLSSVSGLTQAQLETACVDDQTKLPAELNRPAPCAAAKKKKGR